MSGLVQYDGQNGFGRRLQTIDHGVPFRPVYDQSIPESIRPIAININVNRDEKSADTKRPFSIFRSKFVWLLVTLAISSGLGYARTRSICQGFKDSGKFYYGMDVNRCVNTIIKDPLATIEQQLSAINARY